MRFFRLHIHHCPPPRFRHEMTMERTSMINRSAPVLLFFTLLMIALLAGCGGSAQPDPPTPPTPAPGPLSASNLNLIFVVSEDLAHATPGDMNFRTANLTSRGLQRSLLLASFLKTSVLGGN